MFVTSGISVRWAELLTASSSTCEPYTHRHRLLSPVLIASMAVCLPSEGDDERSDERACARNCMCATRKW